MFRDSTFSKKFFECVNSKISLTCCTETDVVYQNVLDSERMANLTFCKCYTRTVQIIIRNSSKYV